MAVKPLIIPTILVPNAQEALKRIQLVNGIASWIQIDVLDHTLVKHTSWHDPATLKKQPLTAALELHLMVDDPEKYIRVWHRVNACKRVIWHIEAPADHDKLIRLCRRFGLETGLAIAPATPVATLVPWLRKIDTVLLLGVEPGKNGQKLIRSVIKKIDTLKKLSPKTPLGWDGGLRPADLVGLKKRGVTRFAMGSAIFNQNNPASCLQQLQKKLETKSRLLSLKPSK